MKPPQKPVARAMRISGEIASPRADSAVSMPIVRHPNTLAARVPTGHTSEKRCAPTLSPYRTTEPANPPRPTRRAMPHGFVILPDRLPLEKSDDQPVHGIRRLSLKGMTCAGDDLDFQMFDVGLGPIDDLPILNADFVIPKHQQNR